MYLTIEIMRYAFLVVLGVGLGQGVRECFDERRYMDAIGVAALWVSLVCAWTIVVAFAHMALS